MRDRWELTTALRKVRDGDYVRHVVQMPGRPPTIMFGPCWEQHARLFAGTGHILRWEDGQPGTYVKDVLSVSTADGAPSSNVLVYMDSESDVWVREDRFIPPRYVYADPTALALTATELSRRHGPLEPLA